MEDIHAGTIKFYNAANESCKFVIKPDNDKLYIAPAFPENSQPDFQEEDRVAYETIKWHVYFSGQDFPAYFAGIPINTKYVNLEKVAVNIKKIF